MPTGEQELICSAKGCRAAAEFDVRWNNAKLHTPDRRKHWLACTAHHESLSAFLSARGMLREVVELSAVDDGDADNPGNADNVDSADDQVD